MTDVEKVLNLLYDGYFHDIIYAVNDDEQDFIRFVNPAGHDPWEDPYIVFEYDKLFEELKVLSVERQRTAGH